MVKCFLLTKQKLSAHEALESGWTTRFFPGPGNWQSSLPNLTLRYTRIVFTLKLMRLMQDMLGYGLAVEGLARLDAEAYR